MMTLSVNNTPNDFPVQLMFNGLRDISAHNKADDKNYDPHLELIEGSLLGEREELLWEEYQNIKTKNDFLRLQKDVESYRTDLHEQWKNIPKDERNNRAMFIAYLVNKMIGKGYRLGFEE